MHSSPLDELSALSPLLLPVRSIASPPPSEFGPFSYSLHAGAGGGMTVDAALSSSASSGLLMSTSSSTSTFAPQQAFGAAHSSYPELPAPRQHRQQPAHSPSAPLSSSQLILARLLEIERSLQYLTTSAYCHPILATGLSSQLYVIKYAMHALSAEEKKLTAWQLRRQQRAMDRRQQRRSRVERETAVKSEEDEAGMSMRGEGEMDPGLSMMVSGLQWHGAEEATGWQRQQHGAEAEEEAEEEERRQSEMHELRVSRAEMRHVGEWINAQLAALHGQVQSQLAYYPSPPSSPPSRPPPPPAQPPPPSASTGTGSPGVGRHASTQHRPASSASSSAWSTTGVSHVGGAGSSSSSSFHAAQQYPTASTTSTGSAYPTYSASTTGSLPPPPLDERSVSSGSRSSLSSPTSPPPMSRPPPLFASQSLPVWSSGAGDVSPSGYSAVYRRIEGQHSTDRPYSERDDVVDASFVAAAPSTAHSAHSSSLLVSVHASTHRSRAEQSAHSPPHHPASSQPLGAPVHASTVSRAAASWTRSSYTAHPALASTAHTAEGRRRGRQRPQSHSQEVAAAAEWQAEHRRLHMQLSHQRAQQPHEQAELAAQGRRMSFSAAETGSTEAAEAVEGSDGGGQRRRGGSRRRKRDVSEEAGPVFAFPRAPHSTFPRLPSAADNPHELPSSHAQQSNA